MRGRVALGQRVGAALGLALVLAAISTTARGEAESASALIFGSMEASPSAFVTAGVKLAADRIDRDGFVALVSGGAGARSERSPALMRWTAIGAGLVGYQWINDWGVAALYGGPEVSVEALSGLGALAVAPARFGLRLHGEVWARPTEATLVTATVILGSTRGSAWSRVSWGHSIWGAYLGPEAALYVDETGYRKWSLGLHATDFSIARLSFRASAGYLMESSATGGSLYVALSVWSPL